MLWRQRLHTVDCEEELGIHGLLRPQATVVVEGGDALGDRHEVRRACLCDRRDKVDDGLLGLTVVPRRQSIIGLT